MLCMSQKRVLYGRERNIPVPAGWTYVDERTRWRLLRDGLGSVIEGMPENERALVTRLGEVWAFFDSRLDGSKESGGNWPTLF